MSFPKDFIWGAAAAAYQIEGAAEDDGRGHSVWDEFCRQEGAVWNGQSGQVACDHYHRYKEDVALMKQIGLKAYRFSLSWSRILPDGFGRVNSKGLDFYNRLTDELLVVGITPFVTLFHWDYPYELYLTGGWLNNNSSDWFAEYTREVVNALSDRVSHWMTLNEPQCFIGFGHQTGMHAPGEKMRLSEVLLAAHNVLLAHGKAVQVIRAHSKSASRVGFAPVGGVQMPASDKPEDIQAARRAMFQVADDNMFSNAWWMDPVFLGRYPEDGLMRFEKNLPVIHYKDLQIINQPLDFFGTNIYSGATVTSGPDGAPVAVPRPVGHGLTAYKWPVVPEALYWGPRFFYERYHLPLIITENGMSNTDWVHLDGKVHDPQRIDFTTRYLRALHQAGSEGTDIQGYFHWSILDNFEWAEGYKERFGLVYVDYQTQQRILKDSAYWYKQVIAANGENILG